MRNSVPKCPCKLLQPANWPMAGSSSLEGHFGTGLRARFSSAWSNVECAFIKTRFSEPRSLYQVSGVLKEGDLVKMTFDYGITKNLNHKL